MSLRAEISLRSAGGMSDEATGALVAMWVSERGTLADQRGRGHAVDSRVGAGGAGLLVRSARMMGASLM
jgi:hypothetical protein